MKENIDLYEVDFPFYRDYLHGLRQGMFKREKDETSCFIFSNTTGKKMCGFQEDEAGVVHYYIFETPLAEESQEYTPRPQIVINTYEELQAIINGLKEIRENGGTIPEHWRTKEEGTSLLG